MGTWLAKVHLTQGWLPATLFTLTAVALALLVLTGLTHGRWRTLLRQVAIGVGIGALGLLAAWLVSDVFMLFGVSLGWMVIITVALCFLATGFAICVLITARGWRRFLAALSVLLCLLSTGLRVDIIYGEFTTLGSLFNVTLYPDYGSHPAARPAMSVAQWRSRASRGDLPSYPRTGRSYSLRIPNDRSQFSARPADIYLPPAALSEKPPALPVFVLLAGQPGSPDRLFTAGSIPAMMDAYAAQHDGLAPVVVSPDQNGSSFHNSLCVDSPVYGKAETYLSRDVPAWIRANLPVASQPRLWAIGGFSQGGTCSTQLGARHPDVYGNMLPADGELEPTQGGQDQMIHDYFDGDRKRFLAQIPARAIRERAPSNQRLFTAAGSNDKESQHNMLVIAKAADQAGMSVKAVVTQGSGHDWHTVKTAWQPGLEWLGEAMGLGPMSRQVQDFPNIVEAKIGSTADRSD